MKPIKLKVRGLNSFIEEQVIDFEKLTDQGLFGIFGPTGSGKSTILDGITLALYGEVSRKSANFVNTNCESASISFEFQISGANTKHYLVQREFKTTKDRSSVRSGKCKLIDRTDGIDDILAESTTNVTKACQEIIGLKLEDFTRTVVLPQGKFSEFLKLEGKDRRIMLERLFNLQQYGEELSSKLSGEVARKKEKQQLLQGELNGYEGVNEDFYEENKKALTDVQTELSQVEKEVDSLQKQYETCKEIWSYQEQLKKLTSQEEQLRGELPRVKALEEKIQKGENADKILPHIEASKENTRAIQMAKETQIDLERRIEIGGREKVKAEKEVQDLRKQMDDEVPKLRSKKEQLEQALKEKRLLDETESLIKTFNEEKKALLEKQTELTNKAHEMASAIQVIQQEIKADEVGIETLKIDDNLKAKVQEGLLLDAEYKTKLQLKEENAHKVQILKVQWQQQLEEREKNANIAKEKKILWEIAKKEQEQLEGNIPGTQETLLHLQTQRDTVTEKWRYYNQYTKEIEIVSEEKKEVQLKHNVVLMKRLTLEKELVDLRADLKVLEMKHLAEKLREELTVGEACPVCGSIHHVVDAKSKVEVNDTKLLEEKCQDKDRLLKEVEREVTTYETKLQHLAEKNQVLKNNLEALGEDFKAIMPEEITQQFETLRNAINHYNEQKKANDQKVVWASETYTKAEAAYKNIENLLAQNEQIIEREDAYYKKLVEGYDVVEKAYTHLKREIGIEDFEAKNQEIRLISEEIETLTRGIKIKREKHEILSSNQKEQLEEQSTLKEKIGEKTATLAEKEKLAIQYRKSILEKVDDIGQIQVVFDATEERITYITNTFREREAYHKKVEERYQVINDEYKKVIGTIQTLEETRLSCVEKLEKALSQYYYESVEMVLKDVMAYSEIQTLKKEIEAYREEEANIRGGIQSLTKLIGEKQITEDTWVKVQEDRVVKLEILDRLKEKRAQLEAVVKKMGEQLENLKDLVDKKQKLTHQLALLNDLEKLFIGKRFVEFVATTRLKYVSVEASKRLKEITGGNYGLEVDENGKFLIRDYKNGGVPRDASTLSGGETFLASLALALALSTEIQLKGTAPLELFFLDEGFGTLDENLLEVVMESLERVHHDKLKVGIISHVESIKSRMPVKLILTPAESGKGGSKVKIERS